MTKLATDYVNATRIACSLAACINSTGSGTTRPLTGSSALCVGQYRGTRSTTLLTMTLSSEDHLWLDGLTQECAFDFAVEGVPESSA
jgi:hypothetical protein